jgi:hypothetical protein
MATTTEQMTELSMKLRLSKQATEMLQQRAARSGQDIASLASDIVEQAILQPTVDEVLAPFRKQVAESGMSDQELDDFFDGVREKAFQERKSRAE